MVYPEDYIGKVVNGDCLLAMKGIPDKSVDLTVTSPPYDNLRDYKGYVFNFEGIAQELYRVTKDGGVIVWVVGDATIKGSETGTSFKQALYFKEIGFNLLDTMIYNKNNLGVCGSDYSYTATFEFMFVFSKSYPKTFNILRMRNQNFREGYKRKSQKHRRKQDGSIHKTKMIASKEYIKRNNIWTYSNFNYTGHPAPFPEKLAEDHIISWSNKDDIVLDPMCGSGTTCKMAKQLGRRFIGIEISSEYCAIARERINNVAMQTELFNK